MNHDFSHTLDALDLRLLDQLQRDASLSNEALARRVHSSPATCLRRVRRLRESGLVERVVALVSPDRLGQLRGHGLTAIVEVVLDHQGAEQQAAFESRVAEEPAVQQCYRVSSGPDFILVLHVPDMPAYHALVHRLFTAQGNVRNVRSFFSVRRSKFEPAIGVLG